QEFYFGRIAGSAQTAMLAGFTMNSGRDLEQVAESVLPGEIEAEGTVGAEAISEIGSHLRGERAMTSSGLIWAWLTRARMRSWTLGRFRTFQAAWLARFGL